MNEPMVDTPRPDPGPPALRSARIELRQLLPEDYAFLHHLETRTDMAYTWRFGGQTPRYENAIAGAFDGVLACFVVADRMTGQPLGIVNCYRADSANGHAHIGALGLPETWNEGLIPEAAVVFIRYLFDSFSFRKLYLESLEFNAARLWSGTRRLLKHEATHPDHIYYKNEYWTKYVFAIYKDDFERLYGANGTMENLIFLVVGNENEGSSV